MVVSGLEQTKNLYKKNNDDSISPPNPDPGRGRNPPPLGCEPSSKSRTGQ